MPIRLIPILSALLLTMISTPAISQPEFNWCPANLAGWIHWDETLHQALLCDGETSVIVRKIRTVAGQRISETLHACRIPPNRKNVRYKLIQRQRSDLPFYSSGAIACLQQQINYLRDNQLALSQRIK